METRKIPTVIYAESTPNPHAMKFVANRLLVEDGATVEYINRAQAKGSPLAMELFNFPFVSQVFISGNFISVFKNDMANWNDVALELREFIRDYINEGKEIIAFFPEQKEGQNEEDATPMLHTEPTTEAESRIVELLEEYIRPAVETDGGAVYFKSYKEGIVTVSLRGACSGCPSSTFTLKAGIEGLLKRMMPEIQEVVAESV
ncbi:MAG: NifU family protein [Bacteroidetes bacterium]|nr:NifU family protein [Bacteroidota bacterium]